MLFIFDPDKSKQNKLKHGIDFVEAQSLFSDPNLVKLKSKFLDEDRFLMIGKINEKLWTAIITYRDEKVRIISVRRSRKQEFALYES